MFHHHFMKGFEDITNNTSLAYVGTYESPNCFQEIFNTHRGLLKHYVQIYKANTIGFFWLCF